MILALPALLALAQQCAPDIAPEALLSIATVESRLDPLAINVNHVGRLHTSTPDQAVALASRWIAAGYSVDLGIAQINSRNLGWASLSIRASFETCANLAAAEKILEQSYARASREATGLEAISRTFSLYNTGNTTEGFANHYVARVWRAAGAIVPQIRDGSPATPAAAPAGTDGRHHPAELPKSTFVVGHVEPSVLVFK